MAACVRTLALLPSHLALPLPPPHPPPECIKYLKGGEVYYGLLRLGFGQGRFRRTKVVFFSWTPSGLPSLSVSQRKLMAETKGSMAEKLGGFAIELQASVLEDLSLPLLLDKAKKILMANEAVLQEAAAVLPEDDVEEAFYRALEEECLASRGFFEAGAGGGAAGGGGGAK